jgi:glycosyltransferase involved in cell wall biosynthesis
MNKTPKIFVDAHCFDGVFQGSRTFIKGIYGAGELPSDWQVYLGARDLGNLKQQFPNLPSECFIRYRSGNPFIRLAVEIPWILKKYGFDFAHFQYVSPLFRYCNYIVTTHDILFEEFRDNFPFHYRMMRSFLFRSCLKKARISTTPSPYCRERISHIYRVPPEAVCVIPNGVHDSFSFDMGRRSRATDVIKQKYGVRNFILCVNRIEPRKNHELLLRTFLELELYHRGISLVFIGSAAFSSGSFLEKLGSLPVDIKRFVSYYPFVSQEDLICFYRAARLFVYPSRAEGFGIPPLEAAALGTPVLCANTTAMAAYTFFQNNLFDPADPIEFKRKLRGSLAEGYDEKRLSWISRVVRDEYSWDKSRELLRQVIEATGCLSLQS